MGRLTGGQSAPGSPKCVFRVDEALEYGESEAVLIEKIRYWTEYNRRHHAPAADGFVWVYRSQQAWVEREFPFWSLSKLRRLTARLEKLGVLVIEMKFTASGRDVLHYRLRPDLLKLDTPAGTAATPLLNTDSAAGQTGEPSQVSLDTHGVQFGQVHSKDSLSTYSPLQSATDSSGGLAVNGPEAGGAEQPAAFGKPAWLKALTRPQPASP